MSKGIPDEDFIEAIRDNQPLTTTEVGNALGIARQSAGYRLRQLEEDSRVRSKKAGPSTIWMLVDE